MKPNRGQGGCRCDVLLTRLLLASETVSTVADMEQDAIEGYVEDVMALLRPALLAHARSWDRLGLLAPPPEELAQKMAERWPAIRQASAD